jgi:NAD(P)-dependent dehydrogenase (short-subunit alcohol dehydrogenase family)
MEKPLQGKIALVAGATRGAGRGIACMLGEAGATVYCSGRSSRFDQNRRQPATATVSELAFLLAKRPETIEDTAESVNHFGGIGIARVVDHSDENQVQQLIDEIAHDRGRLDILVNDIWGGDELTEWGKPFWELTPAKGLQMLQRAIGTHIITARCATPLMVTRRQGLIIEITDGDTYVYRGNLYYDLVKTGVMRMAYDMAQELRPHQVCALALTPGFLRSEAMLEYFGVSESNWRDATQQDPHFIASETPYFVGRAAAALAADAHVLAKSGSTYSSWGLAHEYHYRDMDGSQPDWGKYFAEHFPENNP